MLDSSAGALGASVEAGLLGLELTQVQWYLLLGTAVAVIGMVRMLLTRDLVARLIALNVTGIGSLMIILALAARSAESADAAGSGPGIDPVLSALVITGLVITVAFTGLGAVLIRRIEGFQASGRRDDAESGGTAQDPEAEQ
ncbi:NADH-quinone oxidoreductase subunit K [Nesterenkonia sp. E16_7]|nr:NADH-quinone oxidoreductase subunit K [Nesterenkonia sp. E16_10]MBO0599013.1 NADH-quinone oxidoreductase subunit K [Nesterenkonia sp. E16_7]